MEQDQNLQLIIREVQPHIESARTFIIADQITLKSAEEHSGVLSKLEKRIIADFKETKQAMDIAKKRVLEQERGHLNPVQDALKIWTDKITAYVCEERERVERIRREAEVKAYREAEERRRAEAAQLKKLGHKEEAKAILSEPLQIAPVAVIDAPKLASSSTAEYFSAELMDKASLVKAAAKDPNLLAFLDIHQTNANCEARLRKYDFSVPGLKLVVEKGLRRR
jgi:hypothetical protein